MLPTSNRANSGKPPTVSYVYKIDNNRVFREREEEFYYKKTVSMKKAVLRSSRIYNFISSVFELAEERRPVQLPLWCFACHYTLLQSFFIVFVVSLKQIELQWALANPFIEIVICYKQFLESGTRFCPLLHGMKP